MPDTPTEEPRYNLISRARINYLYHDFRLCVANSIMTKTFQVKYNKHFSPSPTDDPYNYAINSSVPSLINDIFNPDIGKIMNNTKAVWGQLFANKLGNLANWH